MASLKYYVRYQSNSPVTNIAWTIDNVTFASGSIPVTASGLSSIPENVWTAVYDSEIDEYNTSQSIFSIQAAIQATPTVSDSFSFCNAFLEVTASVPATLSLSSGSVTISGSITGSYTNAGWEYIASSLFNVTESITHSISGSFVACNAVQQFISTFAISTPQSFNAGTTPAFSPETLVWSQSAGPSQLWFDPTTTSSLVLIATASVAGTYSVIATQASTTPQVLTVSQSLPSSEFSWSLSSAPSGSIVYVTSASAYGNGVQQQVSVSASVAGTYMFTVTETSQYSYYPTASILSQSGNNIVLGIPDFSQSGNYTYGLSAVDLCGNTVVSTVLIDVTV